MEVADSHNGSPGDVLLQGFHWTSCQADGPSWYAILRQNAEVIRDAGFDAVWFPPPSASAMDLGYLPTRWNTFDTAYGSGDELLAAIAAIEPLHAIADVVLNHRCGVATAGADFEDPPFPLPDQRLAICCDDESGVGLGAPDTGESQPAGRDLDHTNPGVRQAIVEYLATLQKLGFRGWRYDEAKGYAGVFLGSYNEVSAPYLSVGEYWDGDRQNVMDWIDSTGGRSMAFDFPTRSLLQAAINGQDFSGLKTVAGEPTGAIGWWPSMCVTFLDDHDTGQDSAHPDPFGDGAAVLQGYAYTLTHPGIPCVFWPHFFDYGDEAKSAIKTLIAVRKQAGLTRSSVVAILEAEAGLYAAVVDGKVAMKIGPAPWDPGAGWSLAVAGESFAVWLRAG